MSRPIFDRAAVLTHLRAHGSTGIADLFAALGGDMKRESFSVCMSRLQADGYVENVAGRGVPAVWGVGACKAARRSERRAARAGATRVPALLPGEGGHTPAKRHTKHLLQACALVATPWLLNPTTQKPN